MVGGPFLNCMVKCTHNILSGYEQISLSPRKSRVRGTRCPRGNPLRASPRKLIGYFFLGPFLINQQPYGRIHDLTPPKPAPSGTLRSADVSFVRVRSAAIARNAIHGYQFPNSNQPTRLQILYQRPIQAHAIRSWLTSHPKIVLPILFFLLGTLTYTVSTE